MKYKLLLLLTLCGTFAFVPLKPITHSGPMPLCDPGNKGCICSEYPKMCPQLKPDSPQASIAVETILADGSDPMPLCRKQKCPPLQVRK